MKTFMAKNENVEHAWHVIDAKGKVLGRLATEIADILRGKNKPIYTPHVDTGDFVVVVNAQDIRLTGNKMADKMYHHHTGYPGGIRSISAEKLLDKKPEELIRLAVKGMMPKNRLGRKMFKKLKVYAGKEHPHQAQQPAAREV
ncbi:MAG: 50S ribosomal protein L13 [Deltaproteobacteria bacterium]|nr:50S ribosomal protein L13 [Candidatus Anaeroferrophillus wilburensis]MBN2888085.1 50S ribosomal protein L13 [Deltaproteobacteria bacterium]